MSVPLRHIFSLNRRQLATDAASAGLLGFVGDIICQLGVEQRWLSTLQWRRQDETEDTSVFDLRRVGSLTTFNFAYIGVFLHFLYQTYPLVTFSVARSMLPMGPLKSRLLQSDTHAHAMACAWVDNVVRAPPFV